MTTPGTWQPDLLAAPADRLVSIQYLLAAVRRKRRLLAAIAAVGLCLGLVVSVAYSKSRTATTSLLLQFPSGADPTRAISTDVSLLQTRAVAQAALRSLKLDEPVSKFQASYHSEILSDAVLRIIVKGPDGAASVQRSNALSRAFLDFRKSVYERQLAVVNSVLQKREAELNARLASVNDAIATFDPNGSHAASAEIGSPLGNLLTQRGSLTNNVTQIDGEIQDHTIATTTVVNGSRVIDPGSVVPVSVKKAFLVNAASGLIAALALGVGGVVLLAVVTTRLRRRADVAAALRAPVLLSVGRLLPPAWTRFAPVPERWKQPAEADLKLVVRHLQSLLASASTQPPALVVVAIDNLDVVAVTVGGLVARLAGDDERLVVVNETGTPLAGTVTPSRKPNGERVQTASSDVVVVVAALNPAKGAEHLREWASDAVVLVTAGHSNATVLESNATMIRAAGLHLRSVVLVGCDADDDTLGAFDAPAVAPVKRAAARTTRKTSKARSS